LHPIYSSLRLFLVVLPAAVVVFAQTPSNSLPSAAASSLPAMVRFTGTAHDAAGKPLNGIVGVTFAFYKEQQGGAPLWLETQNITADARGRYTAMLGASRAAGLPLDLFQAGDARWLGVTISGQPEDARVLLLAVPYALKAHDAETVGGLSPSAFVLAAPTLATSAMLTTQSEKSASLPPSTTITGSGTAGFLPDFTGAATIGNSALFQTGVSPTAKIGVNTATPAAALDVIGTATIRGLFTLPAIAVATAATGKNSQPLALVSSAFNSTSKTSVTQNFRWQAEPVNNNTATPSATLNLLFGSGTATPSEKGLKIASTGKITFAAGQSFPGTGAGTVTSVSLTAPVADFKVTGSPLTSAGTLALAWKVAPASADTANAIVKRDGTGSFNVTGISGSGTISSNTSIGTAISGVTSAVGGAAVSGVSKATGGAPAVGVAGSSESPTAFSSGVSGLDGTATAATGSVTIGVQGQSQSLWGIGVLGFNGPAGVTKEFRDSAGGQQVGVWGDAEDNGGPLEGVGVVGTSDTGIAVLAENNTGSAFPALVAVGGSGANGGANPGVPGISTTGGSGGCCDSEAFGGAGASGIIAQGGASAGLQGPETGVGGSFAGGSTGNCTGVACGADGMLAMPGVGPDGAAAGMAGEFFGDIDVQGQIFAGTKDFRIDDPLDPANKYMLHASVESSEMMNIYTGNVTTDASGEAIVPLPNWFEALNTDFRYQLTVIGQFAQAVVSREVEGHQFAIRTSAPNVKVSWQITGVRQDAYAKAHPLVVEQEKNARERGYYIRPELYGAPEEKQIEWARHPQLMRQMKAQSSRQLAAMQDPRTTLTRPHGFAIPPVSQMNSAKAPKK